MAGKALAHTFAPQGKKASGAIAFGRFVTLTDGETVKQADAAGQRAIGVAENDVSAAEATAGRQVSVNYIGQPWVVASAAISLGDRVSTTNVGKAKTAVATEVPLGIAMDSAAADGDLIPVLLTPGLPVV